MQPLASRGPRASEARVRNAGWAGPGLCVKRDRDAVEAGVFEVRKQACKLRERKIRHGVIAAIFQRRECDALAGAGNAADQQEIHRVLAAVRMRADFRRAEFIRPSLAARMNSHLHERSWERTDTAYPPSSINFCWRSMNSLVLSMPRWLSTKLRTAAST